MKILDISDGKTKVNKPCKYAEGIEGEWECTCYGKVQCEYQDVDYNYYGATDGFKEINVVNCTKGERER